MVVDGVIYQNIERIIERGRKLGIIKGNERPDMSEILYIDLVWRILHLGNDLDTEGNNDFDIKHKKMLQYSNLNKIVGTYEQVKNKKNSGKIEESAFSKVVKKLMDEDKVEKVNKRKRWADIATKVVNGRTLTDEEQEIYDAGCEAGM
ncbi:MAG TPA: hypothetical protein PKY46_13835 [Ignavibacteriaceae bacterium]|jgi:hypothetical protein|nr:hypothetical protein [Ignavibacteriaceae bacterium]